MSLTARTGRCGVRRGAAGPCVVKQVNNTLVSASGSLCVYVYCTRGSAKGGAGREVDVIPPPLALPYLPPLRSASNVPPAPFNCLPLVVHTSTL